MNYTNPTVLHKPAFARDEHLDRVARIQNEMKAAGIDALLVRDIANFYYVTGMDHVAEHDFFCAIIPGQGEPVVYLNVFQRVLYEHAAGHFEPVFYEEHEDVTQKLIETIQSRVGKNSTLSGDSAAVSEVYEVLWEASASNSVEISKIIEKLRMCKSSEELRLMSIAAQYTLQGADAALNAVKIGAKDRDIASAAITSMIREGSAFPPLAPVIAAGYRGGIPYSTFDDAIVEPGNSVFIELTGVERSYVAPLMRTAVVGDVSRDILQAAKASQQAIEAICEAARPGKNSQDVVDAAMKCLEPVLPGVLFHHIIAYPVGIAFPPTWVEQVLPGTIKRGNSFALQSGMTFHLPMSLRKEGEWAVGLSQTIHIGEHETQPMSDSKTAIFPAEV